MKRRLVLAALAFATLFFGVLSWQALRPIKASSATTEKLGAPVLSARRLPDLLANAASDTKLRASIDLAAAQTHLAGSACVDVEQAGRLVVSKQIDAAMTPASTLKLLTASTALDALGANTRFATTVKAASDPSNGVINGPIFMIGGGDPLLMTGDYSALLKDRRDIHTSLESLADGVVRSGVRVIKGGVIADAHRFDNQPFGLSWDSAYVPSGQVGPAGALVVNQGFGRPPIVRQATSEPAIQAAQIFIDLLKARGVMIDQGPALGVGPAKGATLATVQSPPVSDLLTEMLTESDNTTAEILIKDIGVKVNSQGTTKQGISGVLAHLAGTGVSTAGLSMVDGSGLDKANRATCRILQSVIKAGGANGGLSPLLAIAGETGTLAKRLSGTPAIGRVHAKTGTLNGVSGLVGWATPEGVAPLSFANLDNGNDAETSKAFEDRLALILATLPPQGPSIAYAPDPVNK